MFCYSVAMELTGRAPGRQRDPKTDLALVEAVLDLVSAGATLSGLSLVTIAKRAGVSRNSLYRRWKTKDALYLDVLGSINPPLPDFSGPSAFDNVADHLAILIERSADRRASRMLRALNAEAEAFPELQRRYMEEIVSPRREVMYRAIRRGIASSDIRPDIDVSFVTEMLVGPVLARVASGAIDDLDARTTGRRITRLVFDGARPRRAEPLDRNLGLLASGGRYVADDVVEADR
jgi:AcrR family transcriptional regulator